jgi:hypothetical protein
MNERVYEKLFEISQKLDAIVKEAKGVVEGLDRVTTKTLTLAPELILWENEA